jgi:predicted transcriptional regulator
MDNEPWQKRAKLAGLSQKMLAKLLGVAENTVSLQLRGKWASGTPQYVKTVILAWERLTPESREALLSAADEPKT